ncbi:nicotinate-nucleotide adenylyltransferase [Parabacteroides sp. OttesenSCG-928-O15]|nr:nicotinate-nucleotide adenylyltransferase [Parabacteroides sp. OttesenSCG-928-O15]
MIRTGIFSGSFNPIHIGHLALANWLCEYEELDEVWFLITPQNPLKQRSELMEDSLRLEMAEAATRDYPAFSASDFEFHLPRPTYTIDTLRALQGKYADRSFHFIVGADNWVNIHRWKEYEALLRDFPILIYPRLGYEVAIPDEYPHIKAVDAPLLEISSTFIRESFQKGKDVRFFLPEAVRPYFI